MYAHFLQAERAARVQERTQFAQREAEWAAIAQQVAALLQPQTQPQPQVPATQVPSMPDQDEEDKNADTVPK